MEPDIRVYHPGYGQKKEEREEDGRDNIRLPGDFRHWVDFNGAWEHKSRI